MSKNSFTDIGKTLKVYNGYYYGNESMQDMAASIIMQQNREKAGQTLIEYALNIPINEIEGCKPGTYIVREKQMMALFRAYQNGNVLGRKIDEKNNILGDIMPYVLSQNENVEVSQDDVTAIARVSFASKKIAKQLSNGQQIDGVSKWYANNSMSMSQVIEAANILIGMSNYIRAESGQMNLSLSQTLPPELTETVVKGIMAERVNGIDSFSDLSKSQRTGFLANVRNAIAKALGRDEKNNGYIQK